jgi:hypothetical protein
MRLIIAAISIFICLPAQAGVQTTRHGQVKGAIAFWDDQCHLTITSQGTIYEEAQTITDLEFSREGSQSVYAESWHWHSQFTKLEFGFHGGNLKDSFLQLAPDANAVSLFGRKMDFLSDQESVLGNLDFRNPKNLMAKFLSGDSGKITGFVVRDYSGQNVNEYECDFF